MTVGGGVRRRRRNIEASITRQRRELLRGGSAERESRQPFSVRCNIWPDLRVRKIRYERISILCPSASMLSSFNCSSAPLPFPRVDHSPAPPAPPSTTFSLTSATVSSVLNSPPKLLPPKLPRKLPSLPVKLRDPCEELRFISSSCTDFAGKGHRRVLKHATGRMK